MAGNEDHHHQQGFMEVEQGWAVLQHGINKLINIIESKDDDEKTNRFSSEEYMRIYTYPFSSLKSELEMNQIST